MGDGYYIWLHIMYNNIFNNSMDIINNIKDINLLHSLNTDRRGNLVAYQMIEPLESPLFITCNDVMKWYTTNNIETKYNTNNTYLIVKHTIASKTTNYDEDIVAEMGDIIDTQEYKMFDKQNKVWK